MKIKKYVVGAALAVLALIVGICLGFFWPSNKEETPPVTERESLSLTQEMIPTTEEIQPKIWESLSSEAVMQGIDVSKWQGKPDWARIAQSGVDFAMLRVGYHGSSGNFGLDESFTYNVKNADENGVLIGVYFYSLAESVEEAEAEADWVLQQIKAYPISMPVVIDYEMMENDGGICASVRTDIALAFLHRVKQAGYEGMLYVPVEEFENPSLWEKERVLESFFVWGASYDGPVYPEIPRPEGNTPYAMWQYSNTGRTDGISGNVDQNVAYFSVEKKEPLAPKEESVSPPVREFNQTFTAASRRVTAKIEVNLRSIPSMDGEIVGVLKNGEYLTCTGDSDMGWSRLDMDGQRVFAVTTYLLDESGSSVTPKQVFFSASDSVTAKERVNLRSAPSVDAEVVGVLEKGKVLFRTGIGDKGWSRLLLEGQEVFAVTSYLETV